MPRVRLLHLALLGITMLIVSPGVGAQESATRTLHLQDNPARAKFGDVFRSANPKLNAVMSSPGKAPHASPSQRANGVCGDSEPDAGEECDDGNLSPGDGCSATCTIEPGFDCSPAVPGQSDTNLLANGSFESGPAPWSNTGTPFAPISSPVNCGGCDLSLEQQGGGWFWAGGAPSTSSTSATQVLTIPAAATTLTFNVWEGFCVPDNGSGDFVRVTIDGNEVFNSGVCNTEAFYAQAPTVDLAAAPGGPYNDGGVHTIAILGTMDFTVGDPQTGTIVVDNLSVNAPLIPPIPPTPSSCTAVVCGDGLFPQFSAAGTEQCDDGNTANGDGCSASCTIEQPNFICEDPLPPAGSGENVVDGGLEAGVLNPAWAETGTQFAPICSQALCGAALANEGAFFAWFGGSDLPNNQTLAQDVIISSTATDLTFNLQVGICDSADDVLTVEIDGTEIYRYECLAATSEYLPQSATLGAFADGGVHAVQFIGNTVATNGGNSNFFVDNVSIKDNVAFPGAPGSCFELPTACSTPEQFEGGIPADWTLINLGPDGSDGWGTTGDGICGSANWSGGNVTNGGGAAACADSDATGQTDVDGGGAALEMDTWLCSPALDLSRVADPQFSFLVNYQAADLDLNDNGTPLDPNDDFDDDLLEVLVGTAPPNALTVSGYTSLGNVIDHLDSTLELSKATALAASLNAQNAWTSAHICFHYRGTYDWFAQIDNAALRGSACLVSPDVDGDGVPDSTDNCTNIPNPDQRDTNGDGIGNRCDADLNDDCIVNPVDLGILRNVFFTADADANFDGDAFVNGVDLGIMRTLFFLPPGPSGQPNVCAP